MNRRSADDWLADIVTWGDRLAQHIEGVNDASFFSRPLLQDAVSKCVEAIGEAAGKLDELEPDFSARFFGLQLKQARRSRDRLAHGYYHVDLAILWHTARVSIPQLVTTAKTALRQRSPTVRWEEVSLLGIDVGYSLTRATTGIASYQFGRSINIDCVTFIAGERRKFLEDGRVYDAVAIDGPLVPSGWQPSRRECERLLSLGVLSQRCGAAASHAGGGIKLRDAAMTIFEEKAWSSVMDAPVVEAFPNAFLGVMLDERTFDQRIRRGERSDFYYRRASIDGCFDRLFDYLGWHDDLLKDSVKLWTTPTTRKAHDIRAAIVCLLTAGCALAKESVPIGDDAGGYIHLPPRALWADWARKR